MKVFISWSGEASRRVADVLRRYLPCMIQQLKPFMSEHDLSSGGRWTEQLSKELEDSDFGIICLTPENLQQPWILFEAGALTKHVEGRACCLLLRGLGAADVSGPLSQFQNRGFTREEFQKLLFDINRLLDVSLEEANLTLILDNWWPRFEEEVTAVLDDPKLGAPTELKRDQLDVLEEVLLGIRNLERSLESSSLVKRDAVSYVVKSSPFDALLKPSNFSQGAPIERIKIFLDGLSPSQKSIIRSLASPTAHIRANYNDLVAEYSKVDVDSLLAVGLLTRNMDHVSIVNPTVSAHISDRIDRA